MLMSTQAPSEAKGPGSLRDWLGRISSADSLDGLDAEFHCALRSPARELFETGELYEGQELSAIAQSAALSALSAAVHLRSLEVVAFWRPLLKHCLTGKSPAPLLDIQSTARQAQLLVDALTPRPPGPVRDEVLRLAHEAAQRTDKWLPSAREGPVRDTRATRYSRGTFERKEDEDGNLIVRPPASPREKGPSPESPMRVALGWGMTLAAVAAMAFGVLAYSNKPPQPLSLSHYQAFLEEAVAKRIEGTELVLTVNEHWSGKPAQERGVELLRLVGGGGSTDDYDAIRILDQEGSVIARLDSGGLPQWSPELIPGAPGTGEPASNTAEGGMLEKPLRADEIPLDD
jgi:hypothetical protein